MKYDIIDNALNQNDFEKLKNIVYDTNFAWFYQNGVAVGEDDTYYFTHTFYNDNSITSPFWSFIEPVLNILKPKALIRIKANLYPNVGKFINHKQHRDNPFEHLGAIIYLNTNNGKTVLHDDTKIDSKSNRILMFDSSKDHNSTNCTDEKVRLNINFNYF